MPKLSELARAFDTTSATIRRWTADHALYLSEGANPPAGTPRQYTDDDGRVLALVATMRGDNKQLPEIDAALLDGERGSWPPASMGDNGGVGEEETAVVVHLTANLAHFEGKLAATEGERDRLAVLLAASQAAHLAAEKVAATAPMLEGELERTRAELDRARLPFWKRWGKG